MSETRLQRFIIILIFLFSLSTLAASVVVSDAGTLLFILLFVIVLAGIPIVYLEIRKKRRQK